MNIDDVDPRAMTASLEWLRNCSCGVVWYGVDGQLEPCRRRATVVRVREGMPAGALCRFHARNVE